MYGDKISLGKVVSLVLRHKVLSEGYIALVMTHGMLTRWGIPRIQLE